MDASLATGGLSGGWNGKLGKEAVALAARYEGQVFPLLMDATNGRGELAAKLTHSGAGWALSGRLTGVDRRFVGAAGFDTLELAALVSKDLGSHVAFDLGVAGQGNYALVLGGQARTQERLRFGGSAWRLTLEHRLVWALEGEVEDETRAVFTPVGDYADDVDALSGGGFLQNRFGLSAAVSRGAWTVSVGGFGRLRSAELEEEDAVAFVRTWSGQARVERRMSDTVVGFVSGGAAQATRGDGQGYVDAFGWVGVDLKAKAR